MSPPPRKAAKADGAPKLGSTVVLIAYKGFDSASAAAILLRTHPEAQVLLSSANHLINTLQEIPYSPKEIHIFGVGVYGWYGDLFSTLDRLSEGGCKLVWYCDRDYLGPISLRIRVRMPACQAHRPEKEPRRSRSLSPP
jgi:hypothetical protein